MFASFWMRGGSLSSGWCLAVLSGGHVAICVGALKMYPWADGCLHSDSLNSLRVCSSLLGPPFARVCPMKQRALLRVWSGAPVLLSPAVMVWVRIVHGIRYSGGRCFFLRSMTSM